MCRAIVTEVSAVTKIKVKIKARIYRPMPPPPPHTNKTIAPNDAIIDLLPFLSALKK